MAWNKSILTPAGRTTCCRPQYPTPIAQAETLLKILLLAAPFGCTRSSGQGFSLLQEILERRRNVVTQRPRLPLYSGRAKRVMIICLDGRSHSAGRNKVLNAHMLWPRPPSSPPTASSLGVVQRDESDGHGSKPRYLMICGTMRYWRVKGESSDECHCHAIQHIMLAINHMVHSPQQHVARSYVSGVVLCLRSKIAGLDRQTCIQ